MNKVFRVIWSEARNAYVVVSEMAKSHGTKSCSTKKLLAMLIAAGIMTCASAAPVMARNLASEETKIEISKGALANGVDNHAAAKYGIIGDIIGDIFDDIFAADEGNTIAISPKETLGIKGDEKKNITTKAVGKNIQVTLNEVLDVTKVTAEIFDAGATTITDNGLTIKKGPSVTKDGINAGGKTITNVAPGVYNTDAVNVGQLEAVAASSKTEVVGDEKNINVNEVTAADGHSIYKVGLDNNVTLGIDTKDGSLLVKSSVGDVLISNGQIIGDKYAITNDGGAVFANGVISAAGDGTFRAANGSFTVFADGTIDSKMGADGRLLATSDGLSVTKGSSNFVVTGAGVSLSAGENALVVNADGTAIAGGLNVLGSKITNVAAGELSETSKDAVNGSQLHETNINVANNSMRINKLGDRVNKVGAGAAALAALHPMDFDPDDKWSFAAGMGNYAGQNAAAIGAFYRPDEKVMFSVGGTVGNGENMVNAGISFALDRTNHVSNSRTALAREVIDLRGQLAEMGAKMAKMEKAFGMLDETKTKLFPDIPANHWAYEYIAKLAGNGYIKGYPDGNFGGDRLMTRYEFAAMLYRAIENGAALEEKIIKEFEPELGRIRVDRISGEDGDRDKIERVRVNAVKGERDHYGNKIAKAEAKAK